MKCLGTLVLAGLGEPSGASPPVADISGTVICLVPNMGRYTMLAGARSVQVLHLLVQITLSLTRVGCASGKAEIRTIVSISCARSPPPRKARVRFK